MFDKAKIVLSGYAHAIIRNKAKQIARCDGFTKQDVEDIEQELRLALCQRLDDFDPQQGHINVFITVVIQSAMAKLIRRRWQKKRMPDGDVHSICESQDDPFGEGFPDTRPCEFEKTDLAHDVAQLLPALPEDLRELAERLKTQTIAEIARESNVPRTAIQQQVQALRAKFKRSRFRTFR